MKDILVSQEELRVFCNELFSNIGVRKKIYSLVVDGLVDTSLRGVDSHGVRLMPHYIRAANLGRINKNPKFSFDKTSQTTGILDADHGYGIAAGITAMNKAISLARKNGIGAVAVKNSSHFGAAAIYSLLAAKNDMIGLSFTHTDSLVLPFGGKRPFLGTNPICFAAPCEGEEPICLDMATSQIPWNRLLLYRSKGKKLESGWASDYQGISTTDPGKAVALFPLGGYKGYGLGLMIEILCSLLTGMSFGRHIKPMYPLDKNKRSLGHFFMAIDISRFQDINVFKNRMKRLVGELRREPPASGFDKVKVAGDPEKEYLKLLGSFLKGMLFDYDGVLVNTLEDNFKAWYSAFAQYGIKITKDEYISLEGMSAYQKSERISNKYGIEKKHLHDIVSLKEKFYQENHKTRLYGGVKNILKKLKSRGIKLGLVSSISKLRMQNTAPKELLSLFNIVVTADSVKHTKPHPEPYVRALHLLGLHPSETMVVEDTPLGIESSKSANIYCIAIKTTVQNKRLFKADIIIDRFEDLRDVLSL